MAHLGFRFGKGSLVDDQRQELRRWDQGKYTVLEPPNNQFYKWLFQLDDEPNLYIGNSCLTKHPF